MKKLALLLLCSVLTTAALEAEPRRWRVGDSEHPWELTPVTGRLSLGRGWACEIVVDDDGDGRIDEDPVELVDDDGDGLINEDGADPQIDNDGDGLLNEDPANSEDDDGDGLIDEDQVEAFDADRDGLIDEDGPDPQIDNDGDGLLNEDGPWTAVDDDFDGQRNEDPANGEDDDGDGLIDEDRAPVADDPARGVTTWLRPIRLDSLHNLAVMLNERYLLGEFGGAVEGKEPTNIFMNIPSEYGTRTEGADPISGDHFAPRSHVARVDYGKMADGDLTTAFGGDTPNNNANLVIPGVGYRNYHDGGVGLNLMGYFYIDRIIFRPRPSLPHAAIGTYTILYGDPTTIDENKAALLPGKTLVPVTRNQSNIPIKDLRLSSSVLMGRLDIVSLDDQGVRVETAEAHVFGSGFPLDAAFISEMIDLGTPVPRVRRYSRQLESFTAEERGQVLEEFPDRDGAPVNWGRARWKGRRTGNDARARIQFRTGNSLDTHIFSRQSGPNEVDTRGEDGKPLDTFSWISLKNGRIPEKELRYNEIGIDLGGDGLQGWSYWSAPLDFEDGLIDTSLPPTEWAHGGVPIPIPGGMRYLQFRIFFDSTQHDACLFDFLEFDYDVPLVNGGVVAEIFPNRVVLGEETTFRYYLRPLFEKGEPTGFNRIEIDVPSTDTRIDTLKFDGLPWNEVAAVGNDDDPLRRADPQRLQPEAGQRHAPSQFAQAVVVDPTTGQSRLLLKLPMLRAIDFSAKQNIEIVLRSRLFRGAESFTGAVWNDSLGDRLTTIPQPIMEGDAVPQVATDAVRVVVEEISGFSLDPQVQPNPFTPNDDGINDQVVFAFDLFLILEPIDVEVEIFDLSGHMVQKLGPERHAAGDVRLSWNGRNARGERLPPGIYLYRVRVQMDSATTESAGTLALVY